MSEPVNLPSDQGELDRLRQAAAWSAERFRDIFENAVAGIYQSSAEGKILTANPALARMLGCKSVAELMSLDIEDQLYVDPAIRRRNTAILRKTGRLSGVEFELRRTDGTTIFVEEHSRAVNAPDGSLLYYEGTLTDVTARRRAEEALRESQARLQEKNQELTAALAAAQQAVVAKAQFLANISHEIRTPMNAIVGMAALLLETPLTAEQTDYAKTISESAEGLLNVLSAVLDYSRVEIGQVEIESKEFSVRELIEEIVRTVGPRASEKHLMLTRSVDAAVPDVIRGDSSRLRQVLLSLLGNAIKFTDRGGVEVHIARQDGSAGRRVRLAFTVRDTGIGIPADALPSIFDAFTQADSTLTRRHGGAGLGLAISRSLVELMGGTISVESESGKGSTFEARIPFEIPALTTEA